MQKQEISIYREVQRNAEKAMRAIDVVADKVHNELLSMQMSKQSLRFAEIRNEAYDKLLEIHAKPYRSSYLEEWKLTGSLQYNTLLNTSTGRIAELMIRENNTGVLELNKVLNHNTGASFEALGLANKLIDFETKNIQQLTKYL